MIRLHESLTMAEVKRAADIIGCRLISDGRGNVVITPCKITEAQPRQTNANIVKFPSRRRPFFDPPGPETA